MNDGPVALRARFPRDSRGSKPTTAGNTPASAAFFAYVIAFHLAWIAWPYFVYPRLIAVGETTLTYALLNIGLRLLAWVAPAFCYLRYVDRVEPLRYLKLKGNVRRGLVVAAILSIMNLLGSIARFGLPHSTMQSITWNNRIV
jgi:hypothetical protein